MAGVLLIDGFAIEIDFDYMQTDLEDAKAVGVSITCQDVTITFEKHDTDDNMHVYHSSDGMTVPNLISVIEPKELDTLRI